MLLRENTLMQFLFCIRSRDPSTRSLSLCSFGLTQDDRPKEFSMAQDETLILRHSLEVEAQFHVLRARRDEMGPAER